MFSKTIAALLTAVLIALVLEIGFGVDLGLHRALDREIGALRDDMAFVD